MEKRVTKVDDATIGGRILGLRLAMGMSQEELAERTRLGSRVSISQYETGVRLPSLDSIVELAKVFGTTTDYLILGKNIGNACNTELEVAFSKIQSPELRRLAIEQITLIALTEERMG